MPIWSRVFSIRHVVTSRNIFDKRFKQWKFVKNAPQYISGLQHEIQGASELCRYHANCEKFVSNLKFNNLYKITEFYTQCFSFCPNIFSNSHHRHIWMLCQKKIMIQIKLVYMSKMFYYTEVHLSKRNASWVFSIKQNMNVNFQPPTMFVFLISAKNCFFKCC
jgi:carboxypeptidase C (cathepsin A)